MEATELEADVRRRLIPLKGLWKAIAEDADVSAAWVANFVNDGSGDYGIRRVLALDKAIKARVG